MILSWVALVAKLGTWLRFDALWLTKCYSRCIYICVLHEANSFFSLLSLTIVGSLSLRRLEITLCERYFCHLLTMSLRRSLLNLMLLLGPENRSQLPLLFLSRQMGVLGGSRAHRATCIGNLQHLCLSLLLVLININIDSMTLFGLRHLFILFTLAHRCVRRVCVSALKDSHGLLAVLRI